MDVAGAARRDEVGDMAKAVLVFKENGLKARAAEAEAIALREAADEARVRNETERAEASNSASPQPRRRPARPGRPQSCPPRKHMPRSGRRRHRLLRLPKPTGRTSDRNASQAERSGRPIEPVATCPFQPTCLRLLLAAAHFSRILLSS